MAVEALKAGGGSGATLKAFLMVRPPGSELPNLIRTSVTFTSAIRSAMMASNGLAFGLAVVVVVVENWKVFQLISSSKVSSSNKKLPLVWRPPSFC